MERLIDAIRGNSVLQAISILVAVVTALYYFFKLQFVFGRKIWKQLSPRLGRVVDRYTSYEESKLTLAQSDPIFLIAEISRKIFIFFGFVILYFTSLFDQADATKIWSELTKKATLVFMAAAAWNFIYFITWVNIIRKSRLRYSREGVGPDA